MLLNIEIRRFRSCMNVRLDNIKELLVLIGRNGAGKTNILKGIDWACQFASADVDTVNRRRAAGMLSGGDIGITFTADGTTYRYEINETVSFGFRDNQGPETTTQLEERLYRCSGNESQAILIRVNEHLQLFDLETGAPATVEISSTIPSLAALAALYPEDSFFRRTSISVTTFLSSVRYYPLHNFDESYIENIVMGSDYQKWANNKTSTANSIATALFKIINLHLENRDTFNELSSLMGINGLGLIDRIEVRELGLREDASKDQRNTIFFISFIQKISHDTENRFNFDDLSFGTKRILFLLIAMLYDKASVALLEQPEDGVHTGLVNKLVDLFRAYSDRSQFIIASHSTTILNKTKPKEIYFIANDSGYTKARALTSDEIVAAERFLKKEGPLAEFIDLIGDD